jgi:hypothetical protein
MREEGMVAKKEEEDAKPKFTAVEIGWPSMPWSAENEEAAIE